MPDFKEIYRQERVTPIEGEPLRFRVTSRSRGRIEHLVDLLENEGFGMCSCENFHFRIQPILNARKRGETDDREPSRCYHILRVREYIADCVILKTSHGQREPFAKAAMGKGYKLNPAKVYAKREA